MTYPLALAITVYVGIGLAFASFAMGAEQERQAPAGTHLRLIDMAIITFAWPLWALLIGLAKYLGRSKSE